MSWLIGMILLGVALSAQAPDDPRAIVTAATRAIERDSSAAIERAWSRRLERDSNDVAAALGLASLARLQYDYTTGDSLYVRIVRGEFGASGTWQAAARLGLGQSFQIRGMNARADSQYAAAADRAGRERAAPLEAEALIALASVRARTFGPAAADSLLQRAATRIDDGDVTARSAYHCARAAILQMTGMPDVESEARIGAEFALRAGDGRQHAHCQRTLAVSVIDRGYHEQGFALLDDVVQQLSALRDRAALASVLQWRGYQFYSSYEYGRAQEDLLRAVNDGNASGSYSAVAWSLLTLGILATSAGDLVSARSYTDSATVLFEMQRDRWGLGSLRAIQGQIALRAGDRDNARAVLRDALEAANTIGYAPTIITLHTSLALIAMDDADAGAARAHLDAARAVAVQQRLYAWERGLSYHYARLAMIDGDLGTAERVLRNVLDQGVELDRDQPAAAYEWRSRLADVLMRQGRIGEAEAQIRHATDALDSARAGLTHQELRAVVLRNINDVHDPVIGAPRVLAGLVENGRAESAFVLADRRKARNMLERVVLRDALRGDAAVTTTVATRYETPSVTMDDVAAALPERTALLEYVTGSNGAPTTLFIITRAGGAAIVLPGMDSIEGDLRRFTTLVEEGEDPTHLARSLGAALLDEAIDHLPVDTERLVIVTDAGLNGVPFDALTSVHGRMIERYSITIAPSASVAVRLWKRPARNSAVELLAFGDPVTGAATAWMPAFPQGGSLERLPASARESRLVARYAPTATVLLRERASEAWLRNASLRRYRVLHFAAHAIVDEQTPMRTALALSPGDGDDGFVRGADLAALDLDADLVVLSACRTATGAYVHHEGVEGLTGPLLEAGSRAVVASYWQLGDRTAARFVRDFYDAMAAGLATGDALTAAKREALRRGEPPAVWAAFTLVGDHAVRIPLQRPARSNAWLVALAIAGIVALGYGVVRRTSRSVDRTRTPSAVTDSTHH